MHIHNLDQWQHSHNFSVNQDHAKHSTKIVMWLTTITMIVEVIAGTIFGSMALLADGWHMGTHIAAFAITLFAYQYAQNHANNPQYTFGTGKVSVLGGFSSAVVLGVIAFVMALESVDRLWHPQNIHFNEAIMVAAIGLVVNLISALLLDNSHHHDHEHHHDHDHEHHHHHDHDHDHDHQDHNLRAAYLHVIADALTSVLAIFALLAGKLFDLVWMDAVMALVAALVIGKWSYSLIRETAAILLDGMIDKQTKLSILNAIEGDADNRVTDLHVWYIHQNHLAATISLVTHYPQTPEYYKNLLHHIPSLSHVIVEVNYCQDPPCIELPKI